MSKKPKTSTNEADVIEKFLKLNNYSKNTKKLYKHAITKFFRYLKTYNQNPKKEESPVYLYTKTPNEYIKSERDFETDVRMFALYLTDKPPVTQKVIINGVKQFLEEYDINIRNKIWKKITSQRKGSKPLTVDRIPDNQDLKRILTDGNLKCRTYFLMLSSTGMREGELCAITWDDIELENRKINLRAEITKNNCNRYVYFSPETEEQLLLWKERYDNYHSKSGNEITDNRVFPFTVHTAWYMWNNLTKKSGYHQKDRVTGRHIYHIHTLRKFFNTKMKLNNVPEGVVEKLLGHEGYLNGSYDRFTPEEIKEIYDSNCSCLSVFSDMHKLPDLIKPELKKQETFILDLQRENATLKAKTDEITILKKQVAELLETQKNLDLLLADIHDNPKEFFKEMGGK